MNAAIKAAKSIIVVERFFGDILGGWGSVVLNGREYTFYISWFGHGDGIPMVTKFYHVTIRARHTNKQSGKAHYEKIKSDGPTAKLILARLLFPKG